MDYKGKVCIITGAGSGIGRALALALAAEGADLALSDINPETVAESAALAESAGAGQASATALDVTDSDAVSAYIEGVSKTHGKLDLIINNAGIAIAGDARDLTIEHWRRVIEVNLMGVVHGCDAAYKIMAKQGHGHVVNISSLSGLIPFPTNIPYGTTKHAVVGLSLGLRAEGEDLGVKVSAVCPGFIESNIYTASEAINVPGDALGDDLPFKKVPAEVAAANILQGVSRNQAIIVFPGYAKLSWWMLRMNLSLVASTGRRFIRDFRKLRMVK